MTELKCEFSILLSMPKYKSEIKKLSNIILILQDKHIIIILNGQELS